MEAGHRLALQEDGGQEAEALPRQATVTCFLQDRYMVLLPPTSHPRSPLVPPQACTHASGTPFISIFEVV